MRTSDNIDLLATALAKSQSAFKSVKKSNVNSQFNSTYSDIDDVLITCLPTLAANELCFVQPISNDDKGNIVITTRILHKSGQWLESDFAIKPEKVTLQGLGSAISYGRRYSAKAMLGLADDDNDGQQETANSPKKDPFDQTPSPAAAPKQPYQDRIPKMLEAFKKQFNMDDWAVEALINKPKEKFDEADLRVLEDTYKDLREKKHLESFKDLQIVH